MATQRKSSATRETLRFESLENRSLMAADVTAEFINGTLNIKETLLHGAANEVAISKLANGDVRVSASPKLGGHVNGRDYVDFHFAKTTPNLKVNLGDGNDRLQISGNLIFKQVDIAMGVSKSITGDKDVVEIKGITTRDQLNITTGTDDDIVKLTESLVGDGFVSSATGLADQLSIVTGKGSDQITIGDLTHYMTVKGSMVIDTTTGRVNGLPNETELGNDRVSVSLVDVVNEIDLSLGGGNDQLDMLAVSSGNYLNLSAGAGVDSAALRDVSARWGIFARMGDGDDTLNLNHVVSGADMKLDGGLGHDTLIESLDSHGLNNYFLGWE